MAHGVLSASLELVTGRGMIAPASVVENAVETPPDPLEIIRAATQLERRVVKRLVEDQRAIGISGLQTGDDD